MLNETFYIDGVDAKSVGINLQSPVSFSGAVPVLEAQTIPGRNGDLLYYTGAYENRSGYASCFCLQENVEKAISLAGRFLMSKFGYRRLETSDDPDHFWMAVIENSPEIMQRIRMLAPFEINFDCKPQRFLKSGEETVIFNSPGTIDNLYGQIAKPFVTVYGQGDGLLTIGNYTVSIKDMDGMLYLDSETQNAYNDDGNQNNKISAALFPCIEQGSNVVGFSGGITRVEIIPRWWEV